MDGRRFDTLAKALAAGLPRRRLFRIVLGGVGMALAGAESANRSVLAQSCAKDGDCPQGGNPQACCGGVCTNVLNNRSYCGNCTTTCLPGEGCCGIFCHDLATDHDHCGRCGHPCHAFKEDCCGGICRTTVDDPKNCGKCDRACKATETCCGVRCVDVLDDPKHCGKCDKACKAGEVCLGGKCVKETSAAGPPPNLDLVAACIQPTDPGLTGDWRIVSASWTNQTAGLTFLPSDLQATITRLGGFSAGVALTIGAIDAQGQPTTLLKSVILRFTSDAAVQSVASAYTDFTRENARPLDANGLLDGVTDAQLALFPAPVDPDLQQALPRGQVTQLAYRESTVTGYLWLTGNDPATVAQLGMPLINRLSSGTTPGGDLTRGLAYADRRWGDYLDVAGATSDVWYSRLGMRPQRRAGVTDDQWARQQATEGDATDFAHLAQAIPSTEAGAGYTLSTWAGRFADAQRAQAWLDGIPQRLAAQYPDARLTAITEAQGMGEASQGFLYTVMRTDGVAVGVDLYARVAAGVFAVGLSVSAGQMTPGVAPLFADARPLGKGAQAVLAAQLRAPDPTSGDPRGVKVGDVFGDSPLPVANPGPETVGGAGATAFTACAPKCGKRAVQDQTTPYQVWCTSAPKCNEATTDGKTKCSCNLFRRKKKATEDEWYGKQIEKKEYDPDKYDYSCKCGNVTTG